MPWTWMTRIGWLCDTDVLKDKGRALEMEADRMRPQCLTLEVYYTKRRRGKSFEEIDSGV